MATATFSTPSGFFLTRVFPKAPCSRCSPQMLTAKFTSDLMGLTLWKAEAKGRTRDRRETGRFFNRSESNRLGNTETSIRCSLNIQHRSGHSSLRRPAGTRHLVGCACGSKRRPDLPALMGLSCTNYPSRPIERRRSHSDVPNVLFQLKDSETER